MYGGEKFLLVCRPHCRMVGRGSHGSMLQSSIDPVVLAAMIVIRLQTIVSREVAPADPAVVTVGSIQAGTKSNVIGDHVLDLPLQTASEDFSDIPAALSVPYTYWGVGATDAGTYRKAETAGRIAQDIPVNHSPNFAPVIQPTLDTGTQALVVAALAWLA